MFVCFFSRARTRTRGKKWKEKHSRVSFLLFGFFYRVRKKTTILSFGVGLVRENYFSFRNFICVLDTKLLFFIVVSLLFLNYIWNKIKIVRFFVLFCLEGPNRYGYSNKLLYLISNLLASVWKQNMDEHLLKNLF